LAREQMVGIPGSDQLTPDGAAAAAAAAVAVAAVAAVAVAFSSYVKHFVQGTVLTEL